MPRLTEIPEGCAFNPALHRARARCLVEAAGPDGRRLQPRGLLAARRGGVGAPIARNGRCLTAAAAQFVRLAGLKRYFDVSAPWLVRADRGRPRQIVQAVDGIDIEIAKGETFSLVGESGCGKSTVARLVVGLYPPTAGSIEFDGNDMAGRHSRADMARSAGACR
jgi:ABC-type glutathione transport system ATPase component